MMLVMLSEFLLDGEKFDMSCYLQYLCSMIETTVLYFKERDPHLRYNPLVMVDFLPYFITSYEYIFGKIIDYTEAYKNTTYHQ